MLDLEVTDELGITDVLKPLAFGRGRFGERIYDQQSNIIQKEIMSSHLPDAEKIERLGEHIFSELKTHVDFGGESNIVIEAGEVALFAAGGPVVKGKNGKRYNLKPASKGATVYSDQEGNIWQKAEGGGYRVLNKADAAGKPGTTRRRGPIATSKPTAAGTAAVTAKKELEKFMPEIIKEARPIIGYNRQGQAITSDQKRPATDYDPISGKLLVANKDYFPSAVDQTTNTTVAKEGDADKQARRTAFNNNSLVNTGLSALSGVTGGLIASRSKIPKYKPTDMFTQMRDEAFAMRDQGLSATESAAIDQDINQGYANGVEAVRAISGGGATQGAVLSSLGSLGANRDRSYLNKSLQDIQLRRRNQQNAQNFVMQDLQLDQQMFQDERQAAAQTQQQGIALLANSAQELYDEQEYRRSYGPDTLYNELQETSLAKEQSYRDLMELQSQLALNQINQFGKPAVTPAAAVEDPLAIAASPGYSNPLRRQRPTITIPKF